jgi:hypothetical protein
MASEFRTKHGFCILAIALAALTIDSGLAEESHSAAPAGSAEGSSSPPVANGKGAESAPKSDSQSTPRANEGEVGKIPPGESSNPAGIDTRITEVSRRPDNTRGKVSNAKVVKIAPRNLLARPNLAPTPEAPARNSIGVFVTHRERPAQRSGEYFPTVTHSPTSGSMGIVGGTADRLTNTEGPIVRPPPNANLVVRPSMLNHGTINGTNLIRPGSAPSGIGGPAKTVGGLNGTTIRSTH